MRRIARLMFGLAAATALLAPHAGAADPPKTTGNGPAYRALSGLPVMHNGRIKPWDTLAREEVKQIYGRETIVFYDAEGEPTAKWAPSAALFDWSVRPEFWDDQPFILVEYTPLKRLILADALAARLVAIQSGEAPAPTKEKASALAGKKDVTPAELRGLAAMPGVSDADKAGLQELASKLTESAKWLSPRELEEARVAVDGQPLAFSSWFRDVAARRRPMGAMGGEGKLSELEEKAYEVGSRLTHYQSVRDRDYRSVEPMNVMPRPYNSTYLTYTAESISLGRSSGPEAMSPLQIDAANALASYWKDIQAEDQAMPGTDAKFDARFTAWLRDKSVWIPLKIILEAKPEELEKAGFPLQKVEAFRTAFTSLEQAERSSPGEAGPELAAAVVATAHALGAELNGTHYPTTEAIDREIYFNETAPFFKAPVAYGAALFCLILCLAITARRGLGASLRRTLYAFGILTFSAGILLEVFGFYLRVRISGWAPVTNMYETVIWVALVTAVIGGVLELIYRKVYAITAASGVALLATLLAANVPLLDPDIPQLQPVLRSNYWLVIHVLTIVSSYAAFALAMGLGLIATGYYLTATYRRSPGYLELLTPILVGIPVLAVGLAGVYASQGGFGPQYANDGTAFYLFLLTAVVGGLMTGAGVFAPIGELLNRAFFPVVELDETALAGDRGPSSGPGRTQPVALANGNGNGNGHHPADEPHVTVEADDEAVRSGSSQAGGVLTAVNPVVAEIRAKAAASRPKLDARSQAMQATAGQIKPLTTFIYRAMQVGVLLVAAGTILGGVWADYSWGRFWGWDPKEVWALITLLVYLVPLHGRFAGWVNTFTLVMASVGCFLSVLMAWYGVNFVLGVGLHSYGFTDGGGQGIVIAASTAVMAICCGAAWRRSLGLKTA